MANYGRLAALIGPAKVIDLIYTARLIEAEEARAIGLISEILPDHAALQARAEELASSIAGHAPLTLRATKEAMRRLRLAARQVEGDDLVTMCFTSEDFRQGVESFLARRPAVWTGRWDNPIRWRHPIGQSARESIRNAAREPRRVTTDL
jgi:enoyl-CoA hydratase/carnithine racemase